jgi:hypothetical protein
LWPDHPQEEHVHGVSPFLGRLGTRPFVLQGLASSAIESQSHRPLVLCTSSFEVESWGAQHDHHEIQERCCICLLGILATSWTDIGTSWSALISYLFSTESSRVIAQSCSPSAALREPPPRDWELIPRCHLYFLQRAALSRCASISLFSHHLQPACATSTRWDGRLEDFNSPIACV